MTTKPFKPVSLIDVDLVSYDHDVQSYIRALEAYTNSLEADIKKLKETLAKINTTNIQKATPIRLSRLEKTALGGYDQFGSFDEYEDLMELKSHGYYKSIVDTSMEICEILNKCEVVE